MDLKEFEQGDVLEGGICPECNAFNRGTDGVSVASDDGSFFWCSYCGKPSILIHNGARFVAFGKVYEISGMQTQDQDLLPSIEVSIIASNPFWKPNKTGYTYFTRSQIIKAMSEGYREDL